MRILRPGDYLRGAHTPQSVAVLALECPIFGLQCSDHSARVNTDPPRGGTSPNSPRAGRQQGQVSSSRYAGGPLMAAYTDERGAGASRAH